MNLNLKSLWKSLEFKMAANNVFCPPPELVRQEMEDKGWKYKVTVIPVAFMVTPPAVVTPTTSNGMPVMKYGTPELYDRYMRDLRQASHKVYGR